MKPMLCEDDVEKFFKNTPIEYTIWEPKFDGVRCLATVSDISGDVLYTSRNEKVFSNFGCFDKTLHSMANMLRDKYNLPTVIIFDGEVEDITGDFSTVMTQVHREHDVNDSNLRYRLFDIVCDVDLITRKRMLDLLRDTFPQSNVKIGDWHRYAGLAEPQILMENFVAATGMEGIIFKDLRSYYVQKKSKFWCKSKPYSTLDLKVTGKKQGMGKYKFLLGKLTVVYNGVETDVGSGFSDAQRKEFWYNPPSIIEVKFQEVMKSGKLRFPVFVKVRDDKDEVD